MIKHDSFASRVDRFEVKIQSYVYKSFESNFVGEATRVFDLVVWSIHLHYHCFFVSYIQNLLH